jgi:hypothetical protein
MTTTMTEIKVGGSYKHTVHGNCIVIYQNRGGYWIQVWGGPCGDKKYTFKGIKATDLSERR